MYIIGHQNVHILSIIVPIQTYATVQFSFPIYFHLIEVFQRIYQMLCILLANVFNPKIIYYQRDPHRRQQYSPYEPKPIHYGKRSDDILVEMDSPLLGQADKKYIQQVIGSFLYYAIAVDLTIL